MKKFHRVQKILFSFLFVILVFGCTSTPKSKKIVLIEHPERMFWEIKKGDASIFVLGTIHIADKRFYPLEENVLKAFNSADRLVSEVGEFDIESLTTAVIKELSAIELFEPEKKLRDFLTDEEHLFLVAVYGENTKAKYAYPPWFLALELSFILEAQKTQTQISILEGVLEGVDFHLAQKARSEKRSVENLETVGNQLDAFRTLTYEEQVGLLKISIAELKTNNEISNNEIKLIFQAYLNDDRDGLEKLIFSNDLPTGLSEETYKAYKTHLNKIYKERNIVWAKKFYDYLDAGGTTFVFAGAGHFLGDESVFKHMELK